MAKLQGVNVVVGIPSFGMVSTYFLQSRQQLQFPLVSSAVDRIVLDKPIAEARNDIVEWALTTNSNYILWLDDDVIFPPDTFLKLARHNKDIINGVYWSKSNPPMPLLFRNHLEGPYWNWHVGDLIEIDAAGMGLTLVKTDVYRRMSKELGGPWYSTEFYSFAGVSGDNPPVNNTEDLYFYWKAKKLGYKIWADTSVQAFHFDKVGKVLYSMPPNSPQANPKWAIAPKGDKLIADLGAGPISPYMEEGEVVTFDIREDVKPDVVCDLRYIPVPAQTFDIVYSSNTLEHFPWTAVDVVLREWSRILKVGGELRLIVPNLRWSAQRILDDTLGPGDYQTIYGSQAYPKDYHASGFTPNSLRMLVESLGFYDNIEIHEGNPAEEREFRLKATKVRHPQSENITPDDYEPAPDTGADMHPWRFRIYDEVNERPMTDAEVEDDKAKAPNKEPKQRKKKLLEEIKEKA